MNTYIIDAIRTPIGKFGGTLKDIRTDDLAAIPIKELIARNKINPNCRVWIRMIRQESNYNEWEEYHKFWKKYDKYYKGQDPLITNFNYKNKLKNP